MFGQRGGREERFSWSKICRKFGHRGGSEEIVGNVQQNACGLCFFALPQVLIFFPRYEVKSDQRLSLLKITQDAGGSSSEKYFVISFFVIFVTAWFLGLLLSQFGRGHRCACFASAFTACAAICTIAFVDYCLCKCLPEDTLSMVLFALHFTAMFVAIVYVWSTYIKVPQLPTIKWRRDPLLHVHVEPKDESRVHLLTDDVV